MGGFDLPCPAPDSAYAALFSLRAQTDFPCAARKYKPGTVSPEIYLNLSLDMLWAYAYNSSKGGMKANAETQMPPQYLRNAG
jgi:hypothetical protein